MLRATTLLVLNKEEAKALLKTHTKSVKGLLSSLQKLGPKAVIITDGAKRTSALLKGKIYNLTPPKVKVVHTAGAGDAFTAGFLAAVLNKHSFVDALRIGQVNSLSVIQHVGTKNKLLTEREAHKLIKKYKIKVIVNEI